MKAEQKRKFLRANGWVRHDLGNKELWMPSGSWVGMQPLPIGLEAAYKKVSKLQEPRHPAEAGIKATLVIAKMINNSAMRGKMPEYSQSLAENIVAALANHNPPILLAYFDELKE
jgi:hypothetical protein